MSIAPEAETKPAAPAAGSPPAMPTAAARPAGKSVLAADLRITGDIVANGQIEVMGEVDGSIRAKGLTIAADGRMTGNVTAESVEVKGSLQGTIACTSLTLRAPAQVKADITYAALAIESGAQIEGAFRKGK